MTLITGKCLDFDGVSNYLEVPHNANQLLTGGGSIEVWINPTSYGEGDVGTILDKSSDFDGTNGYAFVTQGFGVNRLVFYMNTGYNTSANDSITLSAWNYVVVTWDASGNSNIYINSVKSGNTVDVGDPADITTTNAMRIGNRSGATDRTFDGLIDEVRVYNRVLGLTEIQANYNSGDGLCEPYSRTGLILWLPMLEGSGTSTYDKSTTGLTGTISGATWAAGKIKHTGAKWDYFSWA